MLDAGSNREGTVNGYGQGVLYLLGMANRYQPDRLSLAAASVEVHHVVVDVIGLAWLRR